MRRAVPVDTQHSTVVSRRIGLCSVQAAVLSRVLIIEHGLQGLVALSLHSPIHTNWR